MVTKRSDFYKRHDWFLGLVHLHTDWAFRFWVDWFVTKDVDEGVIQVDRELEADRKTPIHITVDNDSDEDEDSELSSEDEQNEMAHK